VEVVRAEVELLDATLARESLPSTAPKAAMTTADRSHADARRPEPPSQRRRSRCRPRPASCARAAPDRSRACRRRRTASANSGNLASIVASRFDGGPNFPDDG
jgi:hypothetical protein